MSEVKEGAEGKAMDREGGRQRGDPGPKTFSAQARLQLKKAQGADWESGKQGSALASAWHNTGVNNTSEQARFVSTQLIHSENVYIEHLHHVRKYQKKKKNA